ncbi:MAG: hypothetical protein ACK5HK_00865, partial [Pseudanabaena sp.]
SGSLSTAKLLTGEAVDRLGCRLTAFSWRSIKLLIDELVFGDKLIDEFAVDKFADESLDKLSETFGAAFAGESYKLESATNIARHERELFRALDINPQTIYMSDGRKIAVIWILYTVSKLLRLNFRVAIAFCIADYKALSRGNTKPVRLRSAGVQPYGFGF